MEGEPLALVFGDPNGDHVLFTLEWSETHFIHGRIVVSTREHRDELTGRNGIESMALARLREDVDTLLRRNGSICFGDHDFPLMVWVRRNDGAIEAMTDQPMSDVWDIPLGPMDDDSLRAIIRTVDLAEQRFGPLTGWCCGEPQATWHPLPEDDG